MQSSREEQREIRKQNEQCKKKKGKQQNGRLEISLRKLDTKGIFHAKLDTIKDRNGMDLTKAEEIKRWQ